MEIKSKSKKIFLIALLSLLNVHFSECSFYDSLQNFRSSLSALGNYIYGSTIENDLFITYSLVVLGIYLYKKHCDQKEKKYKSEIRNLKKEKAKLEEERSNLKNELETRNKHHNDCVDSINTSIKEGKMSPLSDELVRR